jgi:hypothetical protein
MKHWGWCLAVVCAPAVAGWVNVSDDAAGVTYVDPAGVVREGAMAVMSSLVDYRSFRRMVEVGYWSQRSRVEYDCAARRARTLSVALHAGHMGEGKVIYEDSSPQGWVAVAAGGAEERSLEMACR